MPDSAWAVFKYEVGMLEAMYAALEPIGPVQALFDACPGMQNAVTESLLLHVRLLADMLLAPHPRKDDITLSVLLPGFEAASTHQLGTTYGSPESPNSPCWVINKRLAHATTHRGSQQNYTQLVDAMLPALRGIIAEVVQERARRGALRP